MKKYSYIVFLLLSTFISCNKKNLLDNNEKYVVKKNLPSYQSLFNYITDNKISGSFILQTNAPLGYKDLSNHFVINVNGAFINKTTHQNEEGKTNFFNGIPVEPAVIKPGEVFSYYKNFNYSDAGRLFGNELKLKLHRLILPQFTSSIDTAIDYNGGYSPEIFVSTNNFEENSSNSNGEYISGTKVKPSFTFQWNKDSLNHNGVFIYLEYEPENFGNSLIKTSYPDRKANGIIVDDNGTYTLPDDLFEELPLNARLSVYIGRGNFEYIKQQDGTITDMQMTVLTYQFGELYYKTN